MKKLIHDFLNFVFTSHDLGICLFFLFSLFPFISHAAVITVPGEYPTIQLAIDAAIDGDEIIVSPGTYYENINFNGKNIILRSTAPTSETVVASTIIDGNRDGSVVTFSGTELATCVLSGFTITRGSVGKGNGGGICGNSTLATIQYNIIKANRAHGSWFSSGNGGGVHGCNGIVRNNSISDNLAEYFGGGIYSCNGIISNNTIFGNIAGYYSLSASPNETSGGGICASSGIIQNNRIFDNGAYYGGGVAGCSGSLMNNMIFINSADYGGGLYYCNGTILNNTIRGNYGSRGGGLYKCFGIIINSIIWENYAYSYGYRVASELEECSTPFYSCIRYWNGDGIGNISASPQFVYTPGEGSYSHLLADSPCIDAGNTYYIFGETLTDIDGECRLAGSSVDMGCDEYGSSPDSDGDLLPDSAESTQGTDPYDADTDEDGLRDGVEVLRGTEPNMYNSPPGISIPANYPSIQEGIFFAFPQEIVTVFPGSYDENIHFLGKNITLTSSLPSEPALTVIDGGNRASVVTFTGSENSSCRLRGFTIVNGNGGINGLGTYATIENDIISTNTSSVGGGGIYECNGTIQKNVISNNSANHGGGGLYECNGIIRENTIRGNFAGYGGGLAYCDGTILNNTISQNFADGSGGGLSYCRGTIQNNTISKNSAKVGGGLRSCGGTIQNNTVSDNFASYGGGVHGCNGIIQNNTIYGNSGGGLRNCTGFIVNCVIWANTNDNGSQLDRCSTPSYSCIQNWSGGRGNISADPRFVDPANGNYHLFPDSPCIDAGNTYYLFGEYIADIDGECRVAGSSVDMGSDEYGSSPDTEGDLLADSDEAAQGSDSNNTDTDGDGLIDGAEVLRGTDPTVYETPSGISIPLQYASIQQGLFMAFPSEPVTVSPGTYYENLHIMGKNLTLQSTNPFNDDVVGSTIIDGDALFSVILFIGTENETCIVRGLTIRNGFAPYTRGGGIRGNGTLATIGYNKILGNRAKYDGAGIAYCDGTIQNNTISENFEGGLSYCNGTIQLNSISDNNGRGLMRCDATIQYNTISGNSEGGLMYCDGTIQNNKITANSSQGSGGGLSSCYGIIQNNIISGNSAYSGGGLKYCKGTIQNNIISANIANIDDGGGLSYCGGIIQNNVIVGNATIGTGGGMFRDDFSDGGGLYGCSGTIQNNIISGNSATGNGGGLSGGTATIRNNTVSGNSAARDGGGLFECEGTIENNIISGNSAARDGGGLYNCRSTIQNNTVYGNSAQDRGGGLSHCRDVIRNCIVWQNSATTDSQVFLYYYSYIPSYSCIQDWTGGGEGNISSDPQLVDPANGNFNLRPRSSCIDAGCYVEGLTEDFEGDPRPYDGSLEIRGDGSDFDIGVDEYTGMVAFKDYDFDLTNEGWSAVTVPGFTPPYFYYMPGQIKFAAQDNTNTYGYWTSEPDAVPVIANSLYRTSWTVATDVTDPLAVPHMRLRVNSQNLQQADILVVSSAGDGSHAPIPEGWTTYEMYFVPPESALGKPEDQDDLILSFDILNFDPSDAADGSLLLDSVVVDITALGALGTPTLLKIWSFDTDTEGWQHGSPSLFTEPVSDNFGDALWLIAQDNTNTFGFWSSPSEQVQVEANRLYRVQFDVSSDLTDREPVPGLRLRVHSEDFQAGIMKVISSVTGAEMSPTLGGRTYDLYFYPPQSLVGTDADGILVAFDILNFDPSDAATGALMLNSVLVESLDVP